MGFGIAPRSPKVLIVDKKTKRKPIGDLVKGDFIKLNCLLS